MIKVINEKINELKENALEHIKKIKGKELTDEDISIAEILVVLGFPAQNMDIKTKGKKQ